MTEQPSALPGWVGQLLCRAGWHNYRTVSASFGFGAGGNIEKVQCRRCGQTTTRRAR